MRVGSAFGVAGVAVLAASALVGSALTVGELIVLGAAMLVSCGIVLARCGDRTSIDEQGLRTRTLWKRRNCRWTDITGIDRVGFAAGNSAMSLRTTRVQITTAAGDRFTLPAPFTTDWATGDPDFEAKLKDIRQAWHSAAPA